MIHIFKTTTELSIAAAEFFTETAINSITKKGKFFVALTGGSSPIPMYELLTQSPYSEKISWEKTYVFWGDERWVPPSDPRSNTGMVYKTLLDHVPVPADHIFPMWAEKDPEEFAFDYEQKLKNFFGGEALGFDLILLGLGEDGHTASLFPYTPVLDERSRWVLAYYLDAQKMYRITLTAPFINRSEKIAFITYGKNKTNALSHVLKKDDDPHKYPARLIEQKEEKTSWFVDEQAAEELVKKDQSASIK